MDDLTGKVALVTGAGRGIGKRIALKLAECGADVVVNYANSEQGANEIVNEIVKLGRQSFAHKADVSDVSQIRAMVDLTTEKFGKIDILVNNAAIDPTIDFFEVTESFWDRVVDTNLKGAFFARKLVPR
nr:SDR family NAD(P)-dependent oxidoreductase [Paenibacillus albus]